MIRHVRMHGLLLAVLVLGLAACQDSETDVLGPPAGEEAPAFAKAPAGNAGTTLPKIAFSVEGAGARLYVVNPDGTGYSAISNTDGATDPAWSPDRSRLAYVIPTGASAGLYVANANGSQRVRIYSGPAGAPAWSPDGSKIAFHASVTGGTHLFVVNANGANLQQATAVGTVNTHPAWSPEGLRLAWFSNRSGGAGIWRMSSNGTNRVRLRACSYCTAPAWSPVPGDERIAFSVYDEGSDPRAAVAIMNSNGTGYRTIGTLRTYGISNGVPNLRPSWSPDATQLVFAGPIMTGATRDLHMVNADGSGLRRLVQTTVQEVATAWTR